MESKTVSIMRCISNAGTPIPTFNVFLNNIPFTPDYAVIRVVNPMFPAGSLATTLYGLWSDLANDIVCTFGNTPYQAEIYIPLTRPVQQLAFQLYQSNTTADGYSINGFSAPTITGTVYLGLTIEFVKNKPRNK